MFISKVLLLSDLVKNTLYNREQLLQIFTVTGQNASNNQLLNIQP